VLLAGGASALRAGRIKQVAPSSLVDGPNGAVTEGEIARPASTFCLSGRPSLGDTVFFSAGRPAAELAGFTVGRGVRDSRFFSACSMRAMHYFFLSELKS
jgi:hypothetical protein